MRKYIYKKQSGRHGGAYIGKHINVNPDGDKPRKKLTGFGRPKKGV